MASVTHYLGSAKNVVGGILAAAGFAVAGPFGLGMDPVSWSALTAGAYGVGALVTPWRRRESSDVVTATVLRTQLQTLVDATDKKRTRMPQSTYAVFREVVDALRDILGRAEALGRSPEDLHVVSATIRDYLPTSLDGYDAVWNSPVPDGATPPAAMLERQLQILRDQLAKVRESITAGDSRALADQGRFLESTFHDSELDLGH